MGSFNDVLPIDAGSKLVASVPGKVQIWSATAPSIMPVSDNCRKMPVGVSRAARPRVCQLVSARGPEWFGQTSEDSAPGVLSVKVRRSTVSRLLARRHGTHTMSVGVAGWTTGVVFLLSSPFVAHPDFRTRARADDLSAFWIQGFVSFFCKRLEPVGTERSGRQGWLRPRLLDVA